MKKFLPTILLLVILVNLFAPFSVARNIERGLEVRANIVNADLTPEEKQKAIDDAKKAHDAAIDIYNKALAGGTKADGSSYTAEEIIALRIQVENLLNVLQEARAAAGLSVNASEPKVDVVPNCVFATMFKVGATGTFLGCVAQLFDMLFSLTSALFGLAGIFFDNMFAYSINDDSYRSTFVLEGWGLVRDIVNMFFIFVLLYVAFTTILGVGGGHGSGPKDMIVKVVIIGLLINFSLFATQIIIDTSNILARVFYNSQTISVTKDGKAVDTDSGKPIPMSEVIVSKVNPQKLISEGLGKVGKINKSNSETTVMTTQQLTETNDGAGVYILVTVLAIAINVIGFIVFLTVGLLFVARVIGLWLAMILVPFAFFSYTVPAMADMEMVGYKKWWSETIKMAFLAPVFMFFMYMIIKFVSLESLVPVNSENGAAFILATIVPFIFIMVLLWQAKSIASKLAGTIGSTVTNVGMAMGGLALGGAALGAAALGRQTMGSVSKYAQNDGARENALNYKDTKEAAKKIKGWNVINPLAYTKLAKEAVQGTGKAAAAGVAHGISRIGRKADPHTGQETSWIQRESKKLGAKEHSEHVLDEKAQAVTGNKEMKYKDLGEDQQKTVRDRIDRDIVSKEQYNKPYEKLDQAQRGVIDTNRNPINPNGEWADAAEANKQIAATRGEHVHTSTDMVGDTKKATAVSEFVNALRKGSYDLRNLPDTKVKSKGFIPNVGVGLAAVVAGGVRMGLKSGLKVNTGTAQKDFLKDLGNTLETTLKGMKIEVSSGGGGGHAKADAGHGGGGGGHH